MENANSGLVDYIKEHLAKGFSEADITSTLQEHGWDADAIDRALQAAKNPHYHPQPAAPQTYKLLQALADTYKAITKNTGVFIAATLLTLVTMAAGGVLLVLVLQFISSAFATSSGVIASGFGSLLVLVLFFYALMAAWCAAAYTLLTTVAGVIIHSGLEGQTTSLRVVLSQTMRSFKRVMTANLLFVLILSGPLVLMAILVSFFVISTGSLQLLTFYPFAYLITIGWALVVTFRYSLVSYVALFEPSVPPTVALSRSNQLLEGGGYIFILKVLAVFMVFWIILALLFGSNARQELSAFTSILGFLSSIILVNVFAVLYFNRKAAKG